MNTNIYNQALNLFTGQDSFRDWMNTPFIIGDKVFATDGMSMIAVPCNLVNTENIPSLEAKKIEGIYPMDILFNYNIPFVKLHEAIATIELVNETKEDGEETECKECGGSGEVEYEYQSKDYTTYYKDEDCPICDGSGVIGSIRNIPTGNKIPNENAFCKIKESAFRMKQIHRLYKVADLLGKREIVMVNQTFEDKPSMFQFGEVDIIVMPAIQNQDKIWFNL